MVFILRYERSDQSPEVSWSCAYDSMAVPALEAALEAEAEAEAEARMVPMPVA